jgi:multidrug efflux pump subunit AcrA (membrane-fusion protein)
MKPKFLVTMMFVMALITACGIPAETPAEPSATLPAIIDSSGVTAEGRLEPVRFSEIAFNTSGVISEVLVEEGQTVKKGETLVQLGNESDTNYAAAQLELASSCPRNG